MNPLSITTASGRRVSILCEDDSPCLSSYSNRSYPSGSYFPPMGMNPTPPLSPDYSLRRPNLSDRSDSFCSTISSCSVSRSPLTPPTPEYLSLPPLEKMVHRRRPSFERSHSFSSSVSSSAAASPVMSPKIIEEEANLPPSPTSNAPSPGAAAVIKKSTRKYTCNCGKSFTTSGHLARHARIHTGEKNYECPESGCGARFSRQDNCMQHYRTHQSGGANKRTSRKKRAEAPSLVSHHSSRYVPQMPSFSPENSLAALASVAISNFT